MNREPLALFSLKIHKPQHDKRLQIATNLNKIHPIGVEKLLNYLYRTDFNWLLLLKSLM
ncbi:hypothetical protein ACWF7H_27705 [Peribacillus butanolivorans]